MLFKYKTLLLILSILLPLNRIVAAEPMPEVQKVDLQQTKKHETSTWRKKIYVWAGIATGIVAGVATAAGIYFKSKSSSNAPITFISSRENPLTPSYVAEINKKELIKKINAMQSQQELQNLFNQNPKYWDEEVSDAYWAQHDKIASKRKELREQFLTKISNAQTQSDLLPIQMDVSDFGDPQLLMLFMDKIGKISAKKIHEELSNKIEAAQTLDDLRAIQGRVFGYPGLSEKWTEKFNAMTK